MLLGEGGDVLIHYDVGADGAVSNVGIDRSSESERLDRAAVICVSRHWRNAAAVREGVAYATPHHQAIIRYMPYADMPYSLRRGEALAGIGAYDAAITEFTRQITSDPVKADAYFDRGVAFYMKGNFASAVRDFDKALSLKWDFDEAAAGRALAGRGALEAAPPAGKGT
jgi:TonB family protein